MTETTQMDGRHRSHLATTMLGLSHGWQMRNPIAVRGEEIQAVLAGEDPVAHEAFSLEPGAVFAEGLAAPEAPGGFPTGMAELVSDRHVGQRDGRDDDR